MVIPMNMGPQLSGPPPAAAEPLMTKLKYSFAGLLVAGTGRALFSPGGGIMSLFELFVVFVMGAFVLKEDPHFTKAYEVLAGSICQPCAQRGMHGMGCIMMFFVFNAVNTVFDLLFQFNFLGFYPGGMFLAGTIIAEGCCAYFGWSVYKICQEAAGSGGGGDQAGGSFLHGGGGVNDRPLNPMSGGGAPGGDGSNVNNFSVFSGAGNRLGT